MQLNTVIFDMDGLLIDSEPCWQEAGMETLQQFGVSLTLDQYHLTTGLRSEEWVDYWFRHFQISQEFAAAATAGIHHKSIEKIIAKADPMPGIDHIFSLFTEKKYRIGLATSSPMDLAEAVVDKLGIRPHLNAISSAGTLPFGKPHPQVYMNCAAELGASPLECVCFEDSFNGMIAAKAARMKLVIIPAADQYTVPKWGAADLKLASLLEFTEARLAAL